MGSYGRVLHQNGSLSRCLRTYWRPIEGASFPHTGLEVINGSIVQMQDCDVTDIRHGLRVTGASTSVSISNTHFGNTFGADIVNARFVSLHEVTAEGASFLFNGISNAAHLIRCQISGQMASTSPVQLTNVRIMTMTGGFINMEPIGVACIDATTGGSNVTLRNGATLLNGLYGIEIKGGLAGGPYAYAYGLVTLDCARILNSMSACIGGQDALLNIDADINSGGLRPNEFSFDPSNPWVAPGRYFDICYVKRDPGPAVRAQRNFWNKFDPSGNPAAPAPDDYLLVRSATAASCGVGNLVPLSATPVASAYNSACPTDGGMGGKPVASAAAPTRSELNMSGGYARLLSDKDCEMGQTDLRAQSEGAWAALYAAFDQSASSGAEPDLSVAIALFDPVADFDSAQLVSAGAVCKQYVDVAQVFVAPDEAGQQRAEGRGSSAAWAGARGSSLTISPNPSAGIFTVSLPDSPCTLRVWDALGRLVHEASGASGLTVVDASGWAAGLYVVEVDGAEGKSWGKVVVER